MAIETAGGLSERQYDLRPDRSALGAIAGVVECVEQTRLRRYHPKHIVVLVTFNVRNTFNSLRWDYIIKALRKRFRIPIYLLRILRSYLKDCKLFYNTLDGRMTVVITSSAAQGSILGPDLWNLSYDDILGTEMPENTYLVGYADDMVSVISARDIEDTRRKLNQVNGSHPT